jgi:hypothetical protein
MIHVEVADNQSIWSNFVDQLKIIQNDNTSVIVECGRASLTAFLINITGSTGLTGFSVDISLDGENFHPYCIANRVLNGSVFEDQPKPLHIVFDQDGSYTYVLDKPIPTRYIRLNQLDTSATINLVLVTDSVWTARL